MTKKQMPEETEAQLCDKCGSLKVQDDDGNWYCPNCDTEIDWEGDDDEDV